MVPRPQDICSSRDAVSWSLELIGKETLPTNRVKAPRCSKSYFLQLGFQHILGEKGGWEGKCLLFSLIVLMVEMPVFRAGKCRNWNHCKASWNLPVLFLWFIVLSVLKNPHNPNRTSSVFLGTWASAQIIMNRNEWPELELVFVQSALVITDRDDENKALCPYREMEAFWNGFIPSFLVIEKWVPH